MDPKDEQTKEESRRVCIVCGKEIPKDVGHFIYMDKATCVPCHDAKNVKDV